MRTGWSPIQPDIYLIIKIVMTLEGIAVAPLSRSQVNSCVPALASSHVWKGILGNVVPFKNINNSTNDHIYIMKCILVLVVLETGKDHWELFLLKRYQKSYLIYQIS